MSHGGGWLSRWLGPVGLFPATAGEGLSDADDQGSVNSGMAMSLLAIAASALVIGIGQSVPGGSGK